MLEKTSKAIDFLRWPAFFILFSYLILFASFNLSGLDYLFHIKSGEYILENKQIPREDPFSFTQEGKDWNDHEWFYQVVIYKIYQQFGIEGLVFFKGLILIAAFFLLTIIALKIDWIFAFFLIFFSLKVSFMRFTLRPDHFSFLFFIFFLTPLIFKKKRLLYLLPFIQLFWVNSHGFFFMGPAVLIIYLLSARISKQQFSDDFYKRVKIIIFFTLFACLLNPYPIDTITYPVKIIKDILGGQQAVFYQSIQELQKPLASFSLNSLHLRYLIITSLFVFIFKKPNFFYIFLWLIMLFFSLNSIRNFYFYIPAAAALAVNRFPYFKDLFSKAGIRRKGFIFLRIILLILIIKISIIVIGEIIDFPKNKYSYLDFSLKNSLGTNQKTFGREKMRYPEKLIEFIKNNNLPAKMYNNFNFGSSLIFNFYPERKVFIDGRAEFYGKDFFQFYNKITSGDEAALDKAVKKYKLKGFIISYARNDPANLIFTVYKKDYKCVYFGMDGIIFVKDSVFGKYPKLKEKAVNWGNYKPEKINFIDDIGLYAPYAEGLYKKGYILYRLGFYEKSRVYMDNLLNIYPGHYRALYILAKISYKNKEHQQAFILSRQALSFKPDFKKAKKLIARIYLDLGKAEEAKEVLESLNLSLEKFKTEEVR
jgi:tetratricopeptide (TPR) repeat protein